MIGLFNTLDMGTRALDAQEVGVEVTGQNLANANNTGYTQQKVVLQASDPTMSDIGMEGTGVEVASIQQDSDQLLNGQIQSESSVGGYWNAQQSALTTAQSELNEFLNLNSATSASGGASSSNGQSLSDQLDSLFNAFQSLATNPTDEPTRQSVVNAAQSLASGLNQASQNLTALNSQLNTTLGAGVSSANQLLSDVASLNGEIVQATADGGNANDLMDSREQDLENLAQLVNFQTTTNSDGAVSVSIGGQELVAGSQVEDTMATYDPGNGQLQVETATGKVPLTLTGGSIQGTIDARDGTLATLQNNLNTLAGSLITQVNGIYQNGYDLNGNSGSQFFTGSNAGDIAVNPALQNDPSQVQASGSANDSGDNTVALQLAQLGDQSIGTLDNQTFSGSLALGAGDFGNALSNANDQVDNYNSVNTMLLNQRDSVSGVSLEEQCSNLITFQSAYEASAKIISTVDSLLQTVVSLKSS